ncbi:MAG: aldehyde dehydrogenase family protein [Anaerolineae bacterium]
MEYQNYINGEWVPSHTGERYESIDPATGEVIGTVPRSDEQDVEAAVAAARKAFEWWRLTPAPRRGEILFEAGRLLRQHKQELGEFLTTEMGKVLPEALGDVQEAVDMAFYMGGEGRRLVGATVPSELPNKFAMAVRDPVGVIGIITPWNFPIAIPSWKMFPALVAGNTIVFKPASDTPMLAARFVEILEAAGVPPGVVNLVIGPGGSVGDAIVGHPDVNVVSFTGSTEVGRHVYVLGAQLLKKVHLEMGGKNAIIVMNDADLDLALDSVIWSAFGTTGQRCTAASRVIVQSGIKPEFTERLVERVNSLRLGSGLLDTTDVGPVINRWALENIHSYTGVAKGEGATVLTGGKTWTDGEKYAGGSFYEPTIFDNVTVDMRVAQEEIFGPCASLITVDTLEEAIEVNNSVAYGLSSSIFTRDVNAAFQAMRDFDTGLVYINHGTIGAEIHLPFGGNKGTGNGHREAGIAGIDVFTEWKSIYVDYSGRLQRAQIDTEEILGS